MTRKTLQIAITIAASLRGHLSDICSRTPLRCGCRDAAPAKTIRGPEAAKQQVGDSFYPRVTVAHIEFTDPADLERFAELGVIANFTPWWHGVDIDSVVPPAAGPERMSRTYTAKPLFDAGALVTFSSDDWDRLYLLTPWLKRSAGVSGLVE